MLQVAQRTRAPDRIGGLKFNMNASGRKLTGQRNTQRATGTPSFKSSPDAQMHTLCPFLP
jgi:hypothetical protein